MAVLRKVTFQVISEHHKYVRSDTEDEAMSILQTEIDAAEYPRDVGVEHTEKTICQVIRADDV